MDPLRSMFYARTLPLLDITEIKGGHHCINFTNHEGDYRAYMQRIMVHLVVHCTVPSYFICHFSDAVFTGSPLLGTHVGVSMRNLDINVMPLGEPE